MRIVGHLLFAGLASAALFACVDVLHGVFALVGHPWLGFSLVEEGFVNSIGVSSDFQMWDRIVSVDGAPVASAAEVVAHARSAGTSVVYEVERLSGARDVVTVKTALFTGSDLVRSQSGLAFLGTIFVVISVLFYLLRPGTREAWAFFALFAAIGIAVVSVVDMTMLWHLPPLYPLLAPSLGTLGIVLVGVVSGDIDRKRTWAIVAVCFAVSAALSGLLLSHRRDIHAYVAIDRVFYVWMAACTAGALGLLAAAYFRSHSADRRARMRHIMWLWPVGAGIPILNLLIGHAFHAAQTSLIWNVFLILVPLSTADAIVRHDLLLLNHRARRVVGSITIAVFVGMGLGFLLWNAVDILQLDDAAAMVALAAVLFAVAVPLTHRVQSHVEALLRSRRYDAGRLVAQFSAHASTATHIADVVGQLHGTFAKSIVPVAFEVYRFDRAQRVLRPLVAQSASAVALDLATERWLGQMDPIVVDDGGGVPASIEASLPHTALAVRLAVANEAVGLLVVSARLQRVPYEDTDVSFVGALAGPLAAALVNAVAFEEVERLNRELEGRVAARTEELEEKNRQLALIDKRKDEFVATVSHDFRNPLATIRGSVQTMMRDLQRLDRAEHMQHLQIVDRQEHRLTALCTNLLDLARLRQGTRGRQEPVDLGRLARSLVDDLAGRARDKGIALAVRVEPDAPAWVTGDADRLGQVLQNLIDNAIKFTPRSGSVDVQLAPADGPLCLRVDVTDTGCGVPADALPRLFEPFFQVPSNAFAGQGSGLGLAIVKAVVDAHDGEVSVRSSDRGTRFTILFRGAAS